MPVNSIIKYELKRIDTWATVKITFVISGVLGFFTGSLYAGLIPIMSSLVGIIGGGEEISSEISDVASVTGFIAIISWIVITILSAVLGAMVVGLCSWSYNLVAGMIGGINLTLEAQPVTATNDTSALPTANTTVTPLAANGDDQKLQSV